jgi:hypothetical protein
VQPGGTLALTAALCMVAVLPAACNLNQGLTNLWHDASRPVAN